MKQLISDAYRAEQSRLHEMGDYGTAALTFGQKIQNLLEKIGAQSLLDYGCGSQRSLLKVLTLGNDVVYEGYDPAVPEYSEPPCPAELVCCLDVLEHIEPDLLDNVLNHLAELCDPYGYFSIHCGPALKSLSDGRNAHLIQKGPDWWIPRLQQRFEILDTQPSPGGFAVLVKRLG